jgi:hypothetical protein
MYGKPTCSIASAIQHIVTPQSDILSHLIIKVKQYLDTNPKVAPGQDLYIYRLIDEPHTRVNSAPAMEAIYIPAGKPDGAIDQG